MLKQISNVNEYGFSLLELIVTFSIVAALAVISIPVYSKYRIRAKVATMISEASAAQFAVANDYFNEGYSFVNTNYAANSEPFLTPQSNFISSIAIQQGWVHVTANPNYLGGRQIDLVFQPTVTNNNISWTCYAPSAYFEYAPAACQNSGCAAYTWGPWTTVDEGTTWMYDESPSNVTSTWNSYCASYSWYFGCTCYNATNTNLVQYQLQDSVISNVNTGSGWTYLVVNFSCQESTRQLNAIGSCSSCPGGAVCQDIFTPLGP